MRRLRWAILAAALVMSGIGLALVFTSDHESTPAFTAAANLIVAWSFVGCGFVALSRGTGRFGILMSAVGLTWILGALSESNYSIPYSFGQLVWGIPLALFVHALLAFPRDYLETRLVYATVGTAYGAFGLGPALLQLFGAGDGGDPGPEFAFVVLDSETAVAVVAVLMSVLALFVCGSTIWVLARRWRAASAPLRRILAPVFATAASAIGIFVLAASLSLFSEPASNVAWWILLFAVASVPIAFLVGLLRAHWSRTAVAGLVLDLGQASEPAEMRACAALALGRIGVAPARTALEQAARELAGSLKQKIVISVLAGVDTAHLKEAFPGAKIVRIMPNMALKYGAGSIGIVESPAVDKSIVEELLQPLGSLHWMPEKWIDPFWAGPRTYGYEWVTLENDKKVKGWLEPKEPPRAGTELAQSFSARFG